MTVRCHQWVSTICPARRECHRIGAIRVVHPISATG